MEPSRDPSISRRRLLAVAGASAAIAGCTGDGNGDAMDADGNDGSTDTSGADGASGDDGDGTGGEPGDDPLSSVPDAVGFEAMLTGVDRPVDMAVPVADDAPWYVVLQGGRVLGIDANGESIGAVLDLGDAVVTSGNEQGLLGLALHPEFADNRRAFVRYSAPPRAGTAGDPSHTFVLSEFAVSEDGTAFQPDTERRLLEIPEPQRNHNAGDLAFGPDGLLYVPVGDGGAGGDQGDGHVEDWYDAVGGGNGQDVTENLLGSILRIDVDGGDPYAVPEDNPLVGEAGLDEHYAWGVRNPWGIAFDGEDLYVADVGQNSYEEVNLVEAGGNYGWNVREGTHCFQAEECPTATPDDVRGGESLIDPVVEYSHGGDGDVTGVSIIGGTVYRGDAIPGLQGVYVFGDLSAQNRLFVAAPGNGEGLWPTGTVATEGGDLSTLFAIGQDPDDDLYVLGSGAEGGGVWRVVPDG